MSDPHTRDLVLCSRETETDTEWEAETDNNEMNGQGSCAPVIFKANMKTKLFVELKLLCQRSADCIPTKNVMVFLLLEYDLADTLIFLIKKLLK